MKSKNENEPSAYWRYINGIKFSTIIAAIENFSTRKPALASLTNLFSAIGKELGTICNSDEQFQIFANPDLKQLHIINCKTRLEYKEIKEIKFEYKFDKNDLLKWDLLEFQNSQKNFDILPESLWKVLNKPIYVAIAPFCKDNTPFGYYLFCWYTEKKPEIYKDNENGIIMKEGVISVLNYIHNMVTLIISNHYPIHRDTYVPSFQKIGVKPACILFADIRNFTSAFEISRLLKSADKEFPFLLTGLVKAYLEAASIIISQPGIGRIDKFIGDGIMATFSDYVVPEGKIDTVCCLLCLYSAVLLFNTFDRIYERFISHSLFKKFIYNTNNVINLKLGIGMNFGDVVFDYFGSNLLRDIERFNLFGGYSEYTAIGDNVNTAQRLESLASKPISHVSLVERSLGRNSYSPNFIAPIMLSRTTFMRCQNIINSPDYQFQGLSLHEKYRSSFLLKGKGGAIEAYEIFPKDINGSALILDLEKNAGSKISSKVKETWVDKDNRFILDETTINDLAIRYFPE